MYNDYSDLFSLLLLALPRPCPCSELSLLRGATAFSMQRSVTNCTVLTLGTSSHQVSLQREVTVLYAGVYKEPDCLWKADELDHAVTLVGYGTDPQGEDYWLIK